jgi:hypothetical protein
METSLLLALITTAVTLLGWVVTNSLSRYREDRTRRLEQDIKRYQQQLEEFYGPLFNLLHQTIIYNNVEHEILVDRQDSEKKIRGNLDDATLLKIQEYFDNNYFIKLHDEVSEILKRKLHFVLDGKVPDSIIEYMRHAYQDRAQKQLWKELGISTDYLKGKPFPNEFLKDIEHGLETIQKRLNDALQKREVKLTLSRNRDKKLTRNSKIKITRRELENFIREDYHR